MKCVVRKLGCLPLVYTMAQKRMARNKTMIDTFEGQHVIISNRKKWKYFGNCSGMWIFIPGKEIVIGPGSTPVSLISVTENGKFIREFKIKCIWESAHKKSSTELTDDSLDQLQEDIDIMDLDSEIYMQQNREFRDNIILDFAISDKTGISCHTTSLHCRERRKLVAYNLIIEGTRESGPITDVKNDYEFEFKFGPSIMHTLLNASN